jgi:hypothetical protein
VQQRGGAARATVVNFGLDDGRQDDGDQGERDQTDGQANSPGARSPTAAAEGLHENHIHQPNACMDESVGRCKEVAQRCTK